MKKGFTLVELLGVIILLGIVGLIVVPSITKMIKDSRQKIYDNQVKMIEEVARKWGIQNTDKLSEVKKTYLSISDLVNGGFIEQDEIKDPRTSKDMNGCVVVSYNSQKSKYVYKYNEESCDNISVITFAKNYGGSNDDYFNDVIGVSDGYVAVGGSYSDDGDVSGLNRGLIDGIIVKYDLKGNVVWKKNFGGSDYDYFNNLIGVSDGYIVVGGSYSDDGDLSGLNKGISDAMIVKYDLNGNVVWKKNYGGSDYESFYAITSVSDGFVVIGESGSNDNDLSGLHKGNGDAIIVKYDTDGNVVWNQNFGGSEYDAFYGITSVSDSLIVVGVSESNDDDLSELNKGNGDAIIVKYDTDGNIVWNQNYGGSGYEYLYAVTSNNDGYVVVGESYSTDGDLLGLNNDHYDGIIVKYDTNGNVVWKKNYGGNDYEVFYHITSVSDGYVAVGGSESTDGDLSGLNKGGSDAIIVKYDLNGNIVWKKNYGGNDYDDFYSVVSTNDGYVAVGDSESDDCHLRDQNIGYEDAIIYKLDELGEIDKTCTLDPPIVDTPR